MQQREEEKKAEVQEKTGGKKQAEWIQEFKELRYQWDTVYQNGKTDAMWADGVALNHIREEMLKIQGECHAGISQDDIPPEMPKDYMARGEEIRIQARRELEAYQKNTDYQFLMDRFPGMSAQEKRKTGIFTALGKVHSLAMAAGRDDLVIMREYGSGLQFSDMLKETADKVRSLPVREKKKVKEKAAKTSMEEKTSVPAGDKESWDLEGQMSIYDLAS